MYDKVNILSNLLPAAEDYVLKNDRMTFSKYFIAAEEYCITNNILLGGKVGLDLLVNIPLHKDSFMWELYCEDTYNNTLGLTNVLYEVEGAASRTVSMQTNIKHKEFTINISGRILFKVYSMDRYRQIPLIKLMGPAVRFGYFTGKEMKLISEEMQLIDIYRSLYSPGKVDLWKQYMDYEDKIYNLIKENLTEKSTVELTKEGGAEKITKDFIEELLFSSIIKDQHTVLIGDYAMNYLNLEDSPSRIQIITDKSIDEINSIISKTLNKIVVKSVAYNLNLPNDFQITKHTIYLVTNEQVPVMDVFNCSSYELIPYKKINKIKIANPWVILRFKFIDLWVLKIILNLGTDNPEYIKSRSKNIIYSADKLRNFIINKIKDDPFYLFQLDNYNGIYTNETVQKKKLIKAIGHRFPIYYPAKKQSN